MIEIVAVAALVVVLLLAFKLPRTGLIVGIALVVVGAALALTSSSGGGEWRWLPSCGSSSGEGPGLGIDRVLGVFVMVLGGIGAGVGTIRVLNDRQIAIDAAEEV